MHSDSPTCNLIGFDSRQNVLNRLVRFDRTDQAVTGHQSEGSLVRKVTGLNPSGGSRPENLAGGTAPSRANVPQGGFNL